MLGRGVLRERVGLKVALRPYQIDNRWLWSREGGNETLIFEVCKLLCMSTHLTFAWYHTGQPFRQGGRHSPAHVAHDVVVACIQYGLVLILHPTQIKPEPWLLS